MNQPPANYRVSLKAVIRDEQGRVLLVKEQSDGWWGLPGGGLDHGENIADGLRRELREEVGAEVAHIEATPSWVCTMTAEGHNPENRPGRRHKLWLVYRVELAGPPQATPDTKIKWFAPSEITRDVLADYFAPAYDEFMNYLRKGAPNGTS